MSTVHAKAAALRPLYEDQVLLVLNKPAGLLVGQGNPDAAGVPDTLRRTGLSNAREPLFLVHRLDPGASGVLVYARDRETQRRLRTEFERGRVRQVFRVLVRGYVEHDDEIRLGVFFDKRAGRLAASERRGRATCTRYRIVDRVAGHTWLECEAVSGRADQIRPHLAAVGHPLAIDARHGSAEAIWLSHYKSDYRPNRRGRERPLIDRLTLHAHTLEMGHPRTAERLRFEAPLPRDLRATLRQLRRLR